MPIKSLQTAARVNRPSGWALSDNKAEGFEDSSAARVLVLQEKHTKSSPASEEGEGSSFIIVISVNEDKEVLFEVLDAQAQQLASTVLGLNSVSTAKADRMMSNYTKWKELPSLAEIVWLYTGHLPN